MSKKKSEQEIEWVAPARPYKKRDRVFFQTAGALAFLLIVIAIFIREWLLIGAILAIIFVSYVLNAVKPPRTTYKITTKGVWVGDTFFRFSVLGDYWYETQLESTVLVIAQSESPHRRILLVVPEAMKKDIDAALSESLVYRKKPHYGTIDKLSSWLKKNIPLEDSL